MPPPLVAGLFVLFAAVVLAAGAMRASRDLHEGLLANILRQPGSFFDTTPQGRILNRFAKDVDVIDMMIPRNCSMCLMTTLGAISTFVVLGISVPWILAVIPPLGILYFLVQVAGVVAS